LRRIEQKKPQAWRADPTPCLALITFIFPEILNSAFETLKPSAFQARYWDISGQKKGGPCLPLSSFSKYSKLGGPVEASDIPRSGPALRNFSLAPAPFQTGATPRIFWDARA